MAHALIVEDDADSAQALRHLVAAQRFTVSVAGNLRDARRFIALQPPDVLLLDLQLPDGSGMELCEDRELMASAEVVLITGQEHLASSAQAQRLGVADYLVKPVNLAQLQGVLSRVTRPAVLQAEVADLASQVQRCGHFGSLWGRSPPMLRLYDQIARVAVTSVPVFINGESGTGKELVAQRVHELSRRRRQPFLAVNCGAISPQLIESEIFGHEKGAFTGADSQHQGFFERAHGGTLFLDELTEMPLELQVKLLRVLETGRFMRVGSTRSLESDVRLIAASNRPLLQAVQAGKLREDLLYRLNVFPIDMPPLRERLEDVPLLAEHFLRAIGEREGQPRQFSPQALAQLLRHRWPGNVRELRNVVQRAYVMASGDRVESVDLPAAPALAVPPAAPTAMPANRLFSGMAGGASGFTAVPVPSVGLAWPAGAGHEATPPQDAAPVPLPADDALHLHLPLGYSLEAMERAFILATLQHCQQHKEQTAAMLGISLKTLYNRLKRYADEAAAAD